MARVTVSKRVLEALLGRLEARWNDAYAEAAAEYGIPAIEIQFPLDLSSATQSFIWGKVGEDLVFENAPAMPNYMSVWADGFTQENNEKPRTVSGRLVVGLDVRVNWIGDPTKKSFALYHMAVEEATATAVMPWTSGGGWGAGVTFNGAFTCVPEVVEDAEGAQRRQFTQVISQRLTFQVDVGGGGVE